MSYEGYDQHICQNGHLFDVDAFYSSLDNVTCPTCKASSVFSNVVDQTNGEDFGIMDWSAFVITEAVYETCNLGHQHLISPAVYRIPTKEEANEARHFLGRNNECIPLSKYEEYHNVVVSDWVRNT